MNRRVIIILMLLITGVNLTTAQIKGAINLSYGLANNVNLGALGHNKSVVPLIVGVSFENKLSKKIYAAWSLHARYGIRYYRSGYGFNDYLSDQDDFKDANDLDTFSDIESKLSQSFIGLPMGFELRFNPNPALKPGRPACSITLLVNNSFLLSSNFNERVDQNETGWISQAGDFKPYAKTYHLGFTVDVTVLRFFNTGVIYQPISYKKASDKFNFNGRSQSPFFELVADNGTYKDFVFYMGVNLPLSIFNRKG